MPARLDFIFLCHRNFLGAWESSGGRSGAVFGGTHFTTALRKVDLGGHKICGSKILFLCATEISKAPPLAASDYYLLLSPNQTLHITQIQSEASRGTSLIAVAKNKWIMNNEVLISVAKINK